MSDSETIHSKPDSENSLSQSPSGSSPIFSKPDLKIAPSFQVKASDTTLLSAPPGLR